MRVRAAVAVCGCYRPVAQCPILWFCFLFLSVCTRVRECVCVCAAAVAVVDAIRLSLLCPNCFVVVVDFTYFCTEGHVLQ